VLYGVVTHSYAALQSALLPQNPYCPLTPMGPTHEGMPVCVGWQCFPLPQPGAGNIGSQLPPPPPEDDEDAAADVATPTLEAETPTLEAETPTLEAETPTLLAEVFVVALEEHCPPSQPNPSGQALSQAPQWFASAVVSTHMPPHATSPPLQLPLPVLLVFAVTPEVPPTPPPVPYGFEPSPAWAHATKRSAEKTKIRMLSLRYRDGAQVQARRSSGGSRGASPSPGTLSACLRAKPAKSFARRPTWEMPL